MSSQRNLYILCGGQSRRMGSDKALLKIDGVSLLERQIRKANKYFDEVVLLCGRNSYPVEIRHLKDDFEDAGPLAGLLKALQDGAKHSLRQVAIIAVDLPSLTDQTIKKLSAITLAESVDAVLLQSGDDLQPLAGVYKTDLLNKLEQYLSTGNRMVFGFTNGLKFSTIEVEPVELVNLNKPDEYK